jgi:hypothetical protein
MRIQSTCAFPLNVTTSANTGHALAIEAITTAEIVATATFHAEIITKKVVRCHRGSGETNVETEVYNCHRHICVPHFFLLIVTIFLSLILLLVLLRLANIRQRSVDVDQSRVCDDR